MSIKIALAGNPNCGKTTLFNALTGSNQFVGNWPGVTVEKKEGKLKGHSDVTIMDLPGIYSLSPYTLEEVVARNYLVGERPDAILNIVDGTNIERNLYLSTQLMELGIPVIMAVNMMDILEKNGDKIHLDKLSEKLGCPVVAISALKGTGIKEAADKAVDLAKKAATVTIAHSFADSVEAVISAVEAKIGSDVADEQKRFFAIKLIEKDDKIKDMMKSVPDVSAEVQKLEDEFDDDTESIITNERYQYISSIIHDCCTKSKKSEGGSVSDKIDKVVTNRWAALPIFAAVMFLVYYISVTTVGSWATDWANDGVFGDGWHLFGIGTSAYNDAADEYAPYDAEIKGFLEAAEEKAPDVTKEFTEVYDDEDAQEADVDAAIKAFTSNSAIKSLTTEVNIAGEDEDEELVNVNVATFETALEQEEPDPADYGVWVPGIPVLIGNGLDAIGCADWLSGLILDGIVAGVGAVLGFVPQMLVLFIFLAFLESCGYMARVAFIMDRIFRKFGLSGKSFIPMLIGSGCGVPGVMASRTIENDRDRKMTIMTTTFIPCGAKLPIIALIAGAFFDNAGWVAWSAYFVGIAAIICSGIILKKTKMFAGDPAPFVMELPAYHMPTVENVLRSMWERGWSFIKKAGTIILLSTIVLWFLMNFGWADGSFGMLEAEQLDSSILAAIGSVIAPIFAPLGFDNWKAVAASLSGFSAKESIVSTMGVLANVTGDASEDAVTVAEAVRTWFPSAVAAFSFLLFNLLDSPCLAAISTMAKEMQSRKWFWFAILFQNIFSYVVTLIVYQIGTFATGGAFTVGTAVGIVLLLVMLFLLFRPDPYKDQKVYSKRSVQA